VAVSGSTGAGAGQEDVGKGDQLENTRLGVLFQEIGSSDVICGFSGAPHRSGCETTWGREGSRVARSIIQVGGTTRWWCGC